MANDNKAQDGAKNTSTAKTQASKAKEQVAQAKPEVKEVVKVVERIVEVEKEPKQKEVFTGFLKNKKVIVQFIPRPTKEIRDPKHIAYGGKLEGCNDYIAPPRLRKDQLKNILTKEEKIGLEHLMGIDLSIYSDFWKSYKKGGLFPIALGKKKLTLNLSVPEDYIIHKVLLSNRTLIANSLDDVRKRGSYKYVLVDEGENEKVDQDNATNKTKAYLIFSEINTDKAKMRYILRQFGKNTNVSHEKGFLIGEIGKIIDSKTKMFIEIASDENLDTKVLMQEALRLGVIRKSGQEYYTAEGEPIADENESPTHEVAARFLNCALGQEMKFAIEARIKVAQD